MPPRVVRSASEPLPGFWGPNPTKPPPVVLRPKPPNRATSIVPRTHPPPTRVLPSQTSAALTQSTRSLHASSYLSMSQVSATTACHPAIRSLDPSLTSALPRLPAGLRHGTSSLIFTSPSASGSAARHLHNTSQENTSHDTRMCRWKIAEAMK